MANEVLESLTNWQNDASAADTNDPTAGSNAGVGQSQSLAGNLRLLKSEMRGLSLNASWERWLGVKNSAGVAFIAFTFLDFDRFSVNDDFTQATRLVAVVGRRVKAQINTGPIYGTITEVTLVGSVTTCRVIWLAGSLNSSLSEVQFGPELRAVGSPPVQILQNFSGVDLAAGNIVSPTTTVNNGVEINNTPSSTKPFLVTRSTTVNALFGEFVTHGVVAVVSTTGEVGRGKYLVNNGGGVASDSGVLQGATPPLGAFAITLGFSVGGLSTVPAILLGSTVSAGAVDPTSNGYGTRTVSASGPSGGSDGDVWIQFAWMCLGFASLIGGMIA